MIPLVAPSAGAACAPGGCQEWSTFAETGSMADMTMAPDGASVYVAASWLGANGRTDFVTLAYDASNGATRWRATWDGAASSVDYPRAIVVTPDGSKVLVAGTSQNRLVTYPDNEYLAQDAAIVAYDAATGAQLWSATWNGAANLEEMVYDLAVSADGARAFVVGRTQVGSDFWRAHDALVLGFDVATGAHAWTRTLAGTGSDLDAFLSAAADASGVYAAGFATGGSSNQGFQLAAYDAATGATRWTSLYDGFGQDSAAGVTVAGSRVVATGVADVNAFATIAYDAATGTQAWSAITTSTYGSSGGYTIAASPDGSRVYAAGAVNAASGFQQMLTFGYDVATGVEQWRHQDDGMYSYPTTIAATPGGVFVAGSMQDENYWTYARTIAYDGATGARAWTRDYEGIWGGGLAASPDGARVVSGGGSGRVTLVAYGTGYAPVRHALVLDPATQAGTVGLVGEATYALNLSNDGTVAETVALAVNGLAPGWSATLSREGETTPLASVTLAAGETVGLTLRVASPATSLSGASDAVVTAASADASATASTTTTKEATHVQVPPEPPARCFSPLLPEWFCFLFG